MALVIDGNIIRRIGAMRRTEIGGHRIDLVKAGIVRGLALEIVHPLCLPAAIVRVAVLRQIGRRPDHQAEIVPVEVQPQTGLPGVREHGLEVAREFLLDQLAVQTELAIAVYRRLHEVAGRSAVEAEILLAPVA